MRWDLAKWRVRRLPRVTIRLFAAEACLCSCISVNMGLEGVLASCVHPCTLAADVLLGYAQNLFEVASHAFFCTSLHWNKQ